MSYRLGVDVGGTFTDLLVIDEASGRTYRDKVASTPHDPSEAVIAGTQAVCAKAGIGPGELALFLHGTTVATNAVLEHKIAKVGLIVTEGYRHILQIARSLVPGGLAAWIVWPKPEPMAPLEATIEVPERMGADGKVVRPIDEAALRANLSRLREEKVEAVTICLINSYMNGAHERRVAEIVAEEMPGVPVSISADILPEMQEYERALTTVANSAVRPTVSRYVGNLERELRALGSDAKLSLLRSDGGLMSAAKSRTAPVNLLMSGPAGGVAGAVFVAKSAGLPNVLTLDMGGTSTDVALIENFSPRLRRETSVGHLTVRASSLDVKTVGAGGGSIAAVPELTKALRVGPQSAGAVPGPAAYGRGGELPTVTDANVVLGYLPENLLGGSFKLDREASTRAVQTVADALNISLMEAAAGIVSIVNETMYGALRLVSVQQGYDPRDFALMAFGGAGPLHGNAMGRLMGSWPVVIPPSPGVLCAYGDATTRLRVDAQRSFNKLVKDTSLDEVSRVIEEIAAQVAADLEAEGVPAADQEVGFEIDVRYAGQAFEVPLTFPCHSTLEDLTGRFDTEHERLFTFNLSVPHELVNIRAVALGKAANVSAERIERGSGDPSDAKLYDRKVWMDGREQDAGVYDRAKLRSGDAIAGPAVVIEMDSTTLVHTEHVARVDDFGNILITPEGDVRTAALALLTLSAPAHAEVVASAPDGFTSRSSALVAAPPAKVWAALVAWDGWWSPAHSYSGKPPKLDARAGGALSENWNGNAVLHATVVNAMPPSLLRLNGGFGPLQSLPVNAVLDFALKAEGAGTRVTMTYRVAGTAASKLDTLAAPVDAVMAGGFGRLTRFATTGEPD